MTDQALVLTDEQLEVLRQHLAPEATDAELAFFGQVCQRVNLDPFRREIYAIHRWDSRINAKRMVIQTSIDGYRKLAARTGKYEGVDGEAWCGDDGTWKDVWLSDDAPKAARVGVIRTGSPKPIYATATWNEHVQTSRDGKVLGLWATMPATMLAKCAEAKALRRAFPDDLAGVYVEDELGAQQHKPLNRRLFRESPPRLAVEAAKTASPPDSSARVGDADPQSGDHDAGAPPPPPAPDNPPASGDAGAAGEADDFIESVMTKEAAIRIVKDQLQTELTTHELASLRLLCGAEKVRSSAKAIAEWLGQDAIDLREWLTREQQQTRLAELRTPTGQQAEIGAS